RMADAAEAGRSSGESTSVGASAGIPSLFSASTSVSFSSSYTDAPLIAQQQKCADLTAKVANGEAAAQSAAGAWGAVQTVGEHASALADAGKTMALANAAVLAAIEGSKLAKERNDLEQKLAAAGQKTSFGLFRKYSSYDLWRAQALLESARRYAV